MMSLYEMFANADNGAAMKALSDQFSLNQQQTAKALEALLPAFSEGLKRNAADPMGVGSFMQALASGNHARYMDDYRKAFDPSGVADGNAILGHLFGSKEVSRAVAQQAEAATGLGAAVLKQMLPVIASMVMGGLFKQSTGQMQSAAATPGGNIIGEIIEQMMKQGMGGARQPAPGPMDNPFGQILEQMMGGGQRGAGANPMGDNPLGRIFEEMMKGGGMMQPQARQPEPEPARRPSNPYEDLFGKMFESGAQVQRDYQKGVENIFDQYVQNMNRHR